METSIENAMCVALRLDHKCIANHCRLPSAPRLQHFVKVYYSGNRDDCLSTKCSLSASHACGPKDVCTCPKVRRPSGWSGFKDDIRADQGTLSRYQRTTAEFVTCFTKIVMRAEELRFTHPE